MSRASAVPAVTEAIAPYYTHPAGITLYQGDCRDILPTLASASIDVLLTDPPYGVQWQSQRRHEVFDAMAGDDGGLDVPAVLRQALRVLRPHRHVYVFGPSCFESLPIGGQVELIWDKTQCGLGDLSLPWGPQHEPIWFGVSVPSAAGRKAGDGRLAARLRRGSVLRVPRLNARGVCRHPTEKPVALLRQLIESSSCLGETVLDPFAGSGSTLVAALLEGRRAIGIELDPGHCATIAGRLERLHVPVV